MTNLVKRSSECEILVVDDEEVICTLFSSTLKDLYRVFTCGSGKEALALIETHDFDVVIADLHLPDIEGMDVLRTARKKDDFTELIVITGYASLDSAAKAIEIGVSSYLMKPISLTDLQILVEKAVATRLFHLKSIMLMKHPDAIAPDIKGHLSDITALFHFSRKLMLSLEIPEVMRVVLDEVNARMQTMFCVIAVNCHDLSEIHIMPRTGVMRLDDARQSVIDNWNGSFDIFTRESFDSGDVTLTLYSGRHGGTFSFEKVKPVVIQLSVMNMNIGSLLLFGPRDFAPSADEYQFLYVFTSFVSSIIEHSCTDMHAKLQARTDGLTGIANHRSFHESLAREIARADRSGTVFGLILMDIDDFKKINDTHGHLVGDAVIRNLVERVLLMIRRADTFARYGGEEFGIILPDTDLDGTRILAQRICREIAATPYSIPKLNVSYSVSIGLSMYDGKHPRPKDSLINDADKALYKSKTDGKSRISVN
jgi:two-component system, cell cycle response regulator